MRISLTDLPEPLIEAQLSGNLVIFAGAGVSIPAPSRFPDFKQLARRVALGTNLKRLGNEPIDRFLGRIADQGTNVHEITATLLTKRSSRPNALHRDIIALFGSSDRVRLVTTNFDRHFSTAAEGQFDGEVAQYFAPALPVGTNFRGIGYLHGCTDQLDKRNLILTDRDFGAAYMIQGWARRFLQDLFLDQSRVVLFIGYSVSDPPIYYMSRAIPPEHSCPRYILVPAGNEEKWESLGLIPIAYPRSKDNNKHQELIDLLQGWVRFSQMGALDHERRIREIVSRDPSPDPEDNDYLKFLLKKPETVGVFTRYAIQPSWLRWADQEHILDELFRVDFSQVKPINAELSSWLAKNFMMAHPEAALKVVQLHHGRLSRLLWVSITWALWRQKKEHPDPQVIATWLNILLPEAPLGYHEYLEYLLRESDLERDYQWVLLVLDYLMDPILKIGPGFTFTDEDERVSFETELRGKDYYLRNLWQRLKQRLDIYASPLEPILTQSLMKAHWQLRAMGQAAREYDQNSFSRSAIEPHQQGEFTHPMDILIDAARDLLDWLSAHRPDQAGALRVKWFESEVPLLRRLTVYGVNHISSLSAEEKTRWLMERNLLWSLNERHEVFQLLKGAFPSISRELKLQLLDQVESGIGEEFGEKLTEPVRQYEIIKMLDWLQQSDPQDQDTAARFQRRLADLPEYRRPEHLDLTHWSGPSHHPSSPKTVEELLAMSPEEDEVIAWLLNYQGNRFEGPDREGFLSVIPQAVVREMTWAWRLMETLKNKEAWGSDLWHRLFQGFRELTLSQEQWLTWLSFILDNPELYREADILAEVLLNGLRNKKAKMDLVVMPVAAILAENLLQADTLKSQPMEIASDDWVSASINHPGGKIAEFYAYALSALKAEAGEKWLSLPDDYKTRMQNVISEEHFAAEMGRVYLAGQLPFFAYLDYAWTRDHIRPLLDWNRDERRAQQAWHGFVAWGRWNEGILPDLMPLYEQTFDHLADLGHSRDRFAEHMANIAVYASIHPLRIGWLYRYFAHTSSEDRIAWARSMAEQMSTLNDAQIQHLWENWLEEYWQNRIVGVPQRLEVGEIKEMIAWALRLKPIFPRIVDLICRSRIPNMGEGFFYSPFNEQHFARSYPEPMAQLLLHLLRTKTRRFNVWDNWDSIIGIVQELNTTILPRELLRAIVDEMARLGYSEAAGLSNTLSI